MVFRVATPTHLSSRVQKSMVTCHRKCTAPFSNNLAAGALAPAWGSTMPLLLLLLVLLVLLLLLSVW